jgi:hypothetical protein
MQPLQAAQIDPLRQVANNAKENVTIKSKESVAKPSAKPSTKTIRKVPGQTPAKPSRNKPI